MIRQLVPNQLTLFTKLSAVVFLTPLFCCLVSLVSMRVVHATDLPQQQMAEGLAVYRSGALVAALGYWREAFQGYEERGEPIGQIDALTRIAEVQQALGQEQYALISLERAMKLTQKHAPLPVRYAVVSGNLGNAYFLTGNTDKAERYIRSAIDTSRVQKHPEVLVNNLIHWGNLRRHQKHYQAAFDAFIEAATLARERSVMLSAKALTNALWVAVDSEDWATIERWFSPALAQALQLDDSHDKAYILIALGRQAYRVAKVSFTERSQPPWHRTSFDTLAQALDVAQRIEDQRAQSYALGYLGELYEHTQRVDEALDLTRRAAFIAQQIDAPELLYLWQWQTGRLFNARGDIEEAISSYQNAVVNLQTVRHAFINRHRNSNFNEKVRPVFYALADLLLSYPDAVKVRTRDQSYLIQAQETLELLKSAELEDYFRDDCVTALQSKIKQLDKPAPQTAVLYPILLKDRTELLLTLSEGISQYTVPVDRITLTREVRTLRRQIEFRRNAYLKSAQRLYDWLIRPLEKKLHDHFISTLVIVPDGPLRTIPFSTLHDGGQFLIEQYALATTPGMTLTDPKPLSRKNIHVLLGGLTESVQGFPPLPNAGLELKSIKQIYSGPLLVDNQFVLPLLQKKMNATPYQIVHMATHGQFDSDLRNTFLLTYDDKLTMDRLAQIIGQNQFQDNVVELLTLSACQTAAGDDRAALGLAGIAVKAGARSVLATLWKISDEATAVLIPEFYRNLKSDEPAMSKARALQQAQLKLIKSPSGFQHPFFWAAYLLIGNWL